MSVITFELKEEHLKLLKFLRWRINDKRLIESTETTEEKDEAPRPFGEDNLYVGIDLILNGKPEEFNALVAEEVKVFSKEEIDLMDKIYSELPVALEIVLFSGKFEAGTYVARFHDRQWKRRG